MNKKFIFVLVVFIFFFSFKLAQASVIINEIMYNPAGTDTNREWVELYNNGSDVADIISGKSDSTWRFDDGSSSLHYINDDLNISAGGYAILADNKDAFLSEYPNFSGLVADTSMSLNNSGTIKIWNGSKDTGSAVDSVSYDSTGGGDNDGNSLQLINGSWVAGTPTPGKENTDIAIANSSDTDNTGNTSNSDNSSSSDTDSNTSSNVINNIASSSSSSNNKIKTTKIVSAIKAKILTKSVVFAGVPMQITQQISGYSNETILCGKYFWNFGDGDSKTVTDSTKFFHTYLYPGEYNLSLEYYLNSYSQIPDATSNLSIKVVPIELSISKVGDAKDFFIQLTNGSDYDMDISGLILSANNKIFVFPKNSIILSKNKMTVSGKITGFILEDENNLKLEMPSGEVLFDYNSPIQNNVQDKTVIKNISTDKNNVLTEKVSVSQDADSSAIRNKVSDKMQNLDENLPATALLGEVPAENNSGNNFSTVIFVIFLFSAGMAVYSIRRNRNVFKPEGDDFEILDE